MVEPRLAAHTFVMSNAPFASTLGAYANTFTSFRSSKLPSILILDADNLVIKINEKVITNI